jgi:hypothetical protein
LPGGIRVYDAEDIARDMRKTFQDRSSERQLQFDFVWPESMQHVGDSLAVAYSSDKWRANGDMVQYKHLAESHNSAFALEGIIRRRETPKKEWPVCGPLVELRDVPLPRHFALLGTFEEVDLRLFDCHGNAEPQFGSGQDDGVVQVTVAHGLLGASKIRWSEVGEREDEPFLFVFTERDGVLLIVVGDDLDIKRDGIVG